MNKNSIVHDIRNLMTEIKDNDVDMDDIYESLGWLIKKLDVAPEETPYNKPSMKYTNWDAFCLYENSIILSCHVLDEDFGYESKGELWLVIDGDNPAFEVDRNVLDPTEDVLLGGWPMMQLGMFFDTHDEMEQYIERVFDVYTHADHISDVLTEFAVMKGNFQEIYYELYNKLNYLVEVNNKQAIKAQYLLDNAMWRPTENRWDYEIEEFQKEL